MIEAAGNAEIQFQDIAGTWKTITVSINQPLYILRHMQDAKKKFKNNRVRAIDSKTKQLLDMLP